MSAHDSDLLVKCTGSSLILTTDDEAVLVIFSPNIRLNADFIPEYSNLFVAVSANCLFVEINFLLGTACMLILRLVMSCKIFSLCCKDVQIAQYNNSLCPDQIVRIFEMLGRSRMLHQQFPS